MESRRSVNDRTEEVVDDRSVKERAEAFDLDRVWGMRGRGTVSGASSNVSCSLWSNDARSRGGIRSFSNHLLLPDLSCPRLIASGLECPLSSLLVIRPIEG